MSIERRLQDAEEVLSVGKPAPKTPAEMVDELAAELPVWWGAIAKYPEWEAKMRRVLEERYGEPGWGRYHEDLNALLDWAKAELPCRIYLEAWGAAYQAEGLKPDWPELEPDNPSRKWGTLMFPGEWIERWEREKAAEAAEGEGQDG